MFKIQVNRFERMYLSYTESDDEAGGSDSHCHEYYEICYMIDGEAAYSVEGKKFFVVPDSLLLIPANSYHQWIYPTDKISHRICLHFLPEIFQKPEREFYLSMFDEPGFLLNESRQKIDFFIKTIDECKLFEAAQQRQAAKVRLASLLHTISYMKSTNNAMPVVLDRRIGQVIAYIGEHFQEELTLDNLAERFLLNKNHLNVLFHRVVGTPIKKFVNIKRLGAAHQEILQGKSLGDAASSAGFNNYATFFRAYKSFYGYQPSETRIGELEYSPQK